MAKKRKTKKKAVQEPVIEQPVIEQEVKEKMPREKPVRLIDSLINEVDKAKLQRAIDLGCKIPPNVSNDMLDALIKIAELTESLPPESDIPQMEITKNEKGMFVKVEPSKAVRILQGKKTNQRGQAFWETICAIMPQGTPGLFIKKEHCYEELRLKYGGDEGPIVQNKNVKYWEKK
jgi:hypothetical protein